MWTHPGPGIKPISPELAGRFFNTGPLGKSSLVLLRWSDILKIWTYSPIPKFCLIQKLFPPVLLRLVCFCITGQSVQLSSVQSLSRVQLSVTPWTVACQASLSITNSWSLLKLMSIESVMPSNHLILCHPLLLLTSIFPSIKVFSNESVLHISGQSIGVSASASVLPMNIQNWFPLGWTGLTSLQYKGLKGLFQHHSSNASILRRSAFFMFQLSHPYIHDY